MKRLPLLFLVVGALGCVTTPLLVGPIKDTETFAAPMDRVWSTALAASQDMGLRVQTSDRAGGLLSFADYDLGRYGGTFKNIPTALGKVAVKPPSLLGVWDAGWASPSVIISAVGDKTEVRFHAGIKGKDAGGIDHEMPSRGVIEEEFFSKMRSRL